VSYEVWQGSTPAPRGARVLGGVGMALGVLAIVLCALGRALTLWVAGVAGLPLAVVAVVLGVLAVRRGARRPGALARLVGGVAILLYVVLAVAGALLRDEPSGYVSDVGSVTGQAAPGQPAKLLATARSASS